MSALAVSHRLPDYEPEYDEEQSRIIGAHADHRREDFIFPRMQSRAMQETPWLERTQPLRSWSELLGIGLLVGLMSFVVALSTATFG